MQNGTDSHHPTTSSRQEHYESERQPQRLFASTKAAALAEEIQEQQEASSSFPVRRGLRSNGLYHQRLAKLKQDRCGCQECTADILNRNSSGYPCVNRMAYLWTYGLNEFNQSYTMEEACHKVAVEEFPNVCGNTACDPAQCDPACSCPSCTDAVLQGACGAVLSFYQSVAGGNHSETEACKLTADFSPSACGVCHPDTCRNPPPTCGCQDCNEAALVQYAGQFTCQGRIEYLVNYLDYNETEACTRVAAVEWPQVCGPACDPARCDPPPTPAPTDLPTSQPTAPICNCHDCATSGKLNNLAGPHTCRERINYLQSTAGGNLNETAACYQIANVEFPDVCGPDCDPTKCDGQIPPTTAPSETPSLLPSVPPSLTPTLVPCGCNDCDAAALDEMAGNYTCRQRIGYTQSINSHNGNYTQEDACYQVATVEWPGVCGPACDPTRCDGRIPPTAAPSPVLMESSTHACHCPDTCTYDVLRNATGSLGTCGDRIDFLTSATGGNMNDTWACIQIAEVEFPNDCGPACNPLRCHSGNKTSSTIVSTTSPYASLPTTTPRGGFCGCPNCTVEVLERLTTGDIPAVSRIAWQQTVIGQLYTEEEACFKICHKDFPHVCGPECDPSRCSL